MLKLTHVILTFGLMMIVCVGCSSGKSNPVTASNFNDDLSYLIPATDESNANRILWGIWDVSFDIESQSSLIKPNRVAEAHYNVKPYVPDPDIIIKSYDPRTEIIEVDVTIRNPYPLDVYDVRLIIYTDNIGHELVNSDDWTNLYDIPGGFVLNPFKAYAKSESKRKFKGLSQYTENLKIKLPSQNLNVTFAIDASYPGNCSEPYEISNFTQGTLYDYENASADIEVTVKAWRNDVVSTYLYCPSITEIPLTEFEYQGGGKWKTNLINRTTAVEGEYVGFIASFALFSGSQALYDRIKIIISHFPENKIIGQIISPQCPVTDVLDRQTIDFNVVASSAINCDPITLYEADLDYDGITFNVDVASTDGIFLNTGPFINPNCGGSNDPVVYNVAFRAMDSCDPPNVEIFALCEVTVDICSFRPDPLRKNLDLVTGITRPTSASVELDLAVVESDNPDVKGVYMPDAENGITRYDLNYTDAVFHGPGLLPPNTTGTHPNPNAAMPIRRLDANNKGVTIVAYNDANETYQPIPGQEPTLPAGNIIRIFYCILPPPEPPYTTEFPLQPFTGYYMRDMDDPSTPAIDESLVEDPIGLECWDDFDGWLGVSWETTKLVNPQNGLYDLLYLGVAFTYPPDTVDPPIPSPQYVVSFSGIPADEIKGIDRSSNGYLYYGLSGPNTPSGGSLVIGMDAEDPSSHPVIGGFAISSGNVIDLDLLPYDDTMQRIINGHEQSAPIVCVLTDNKTIELIDSITGDVIQLIDGSADGSIVGTPKHLDVGDKSFTIHVTHLDGNTPRVTVFYLK